MPIGISRFWATASALSLSFVLTIALFCGFSQPVWAIDAPEYLPTQPTNVIDLGRLSTEAQEEQLDRDLAAFEEKTGWKLRVLTQLDVTPDEQLRIFGA